MEIDTILSLSLQDFELQILIQLLLLLLLLSLLLFLLFSFVRSNPFDLSLIGPRLSAHLGEDGIESLIHNLMLVYGRVPRYRLGTEKGTIHSGRNSYPNHTQDARGIEGKMTGEPIQRGPRSDRLQRSWIDK